jgi:hypothetical protein
MSVLPSGSGALIFSSGPEHRRTISSSETDALLPLFPVVLQEASVPARLPEVYWQRKTYSGRQQEATGGDRGEVSWHGDGFRQGLQKPGFYF